MFEKAKSIILELDDDASLSVLNSRIGDIFSKQCKFDKALELFNKSLQYEEEIGSKVGIASILSRIGWINYYQGNYDNYKNNLERIIKIYKDLGHKSGVSGSLHNLALLYTSQGDYEKALKLLFEAKKINEEISKKDFLIRNLNSIASIYARQANYKDAFETYMKSIKIAEGISDKEMVATLYENVGNVYTAQGMYDKALDSYRKALEINRELDRNMGVAQNFYSIGQLYKSQKKYNEAMKNFQEALKLYEKMGRKIGISNVLSSFGTIFNEKGEFKKALENLLKALEIDKQLGNKESISSSYTNIANNYMDIGDFDKALYYFKESIKLCNELGNKRVLVYNYTNLSTLYGNKAANEDSSIVNDRNLVSLKTRNYYLQSLDYGLMAVEIAEDINQRDILFEAYHRVSTAYEKLGRSSDALKYFKKYTVEKDSIQARQFNEKNLKLMAEHESEIQEKEIQNLTKLSAEQNKQKNIIIIAAAIGIVLLIMLAIIQYRKNKFKTKVNALLKDQNRQINQANTELETLNNDLADKNRQISLANTELETLNNDLAEKNYTISEAHQKITDSINYAEKIQMAMLPFPERMNEIFKEHFVLYKPKDVVSGDFYWVEQSGGFTFAAVVDCTGHGVPGAFMSIIGYDLLNQIVLVDKVYEPKDILSRLNDLVRRALHQKDKIGSQQDGMELSIIRIKGDELVFAGARRPLWYSTNGKIEEIKGDKFGIGGRVRKERVFTQQSLKLNRDTKLFMFSDGIIDQNNEKDEFFGKERLRTIFTSSEQLSSVSETLNSEFIEFRSEESLRDDITVLGIKL